MIELHRWDGARWLRVEIGTAALTSRGMVIGPARTDGVTRIYTAGGNYISNSYYWQELSPGPAGWSSELLSPPTGVIDGMALGFPRYDNNMRLYAFGHGTDYFSDWLYEFVWNGSTWTYVPIVQGQPISRVVAGNPRAKWGGWIYVESTYGIYEWGDIGYGSRRWSLLQLADTRPAGATLTLAAGRGDAYQNLYYTTSQQVWEIRFVDSGGPILYLVGSIDQSAGAEDALVGLTVIKGRNDGVPRIYGLTARGWLYEWGYLNPTPPPEKTTVGQPFPNPFFPGKQALLSIPLTLSQSGKTTVNLFTASGDLVLTLLDDEYRPSGTFLLSWDGRNGAGKVVGSGVYVAVATGEGWRAATKVFVIR